jgi:molybdopterin/thiamine biosynthesis adenylyltransferase
MNDVINIMRHESVFNPKDHAYPIHIIGAGATGSRVFAALVELGMTNINVYDPDVVEDHNLANQIYMVRDIGKPKVLGCAGFAGEKLGSQHGDMGFHERTVTETFIREGNVQGGVVFLLTDTMASRKEIVNTLVSRCFGTTSQQAIAPILIVETRMASTHGAVFSLNPFDKQAHKNWLATLVDDSDTDNIELSPCGTALSVGTTASLIANYAVWQMMQFFVDPLGMQAQVDLFFKPTLTITSPAITSTVSIAA